MGTPACSAATTSDAAYPTNLSRGNYVAKLGDCVSCHSAPGKYDFAGGFPLHAPIGIIYGTNITPDPTYGIGGYTRDEFRKAVREGIAKGGKHLYPAMPYPSFSGMTDADVDALYDYFMHEVAPVATRPPETRLWFPLNQRWAIRFWNWLFLRNRYSVRADRDAEWNRGAYLVETIAHCGACHTPRGLAYQERGVKAGDRYFLSGSDVDNWHSANLAGDSASGLGRWSQDDIAQFLGGAAANGIVAFGSMRQVIDNSGRHMTLADRQAIARYLKSLPAYGESARFIADAKPDGFERPGAGLYAQVCAKCHQANGEGKLGKYPRLAGNPIVLSSEPLSVIRIMLEGGAPNAGTAHSQHMPSFANLNDAELASLASYIRSSWGNNTTLVSDRNVAQVRERLASLTQ
jgi:mono/diheme cytochrome c family protein